MLLFLTERTLKCNKE